jgi:hypothetical protein
MAAVVADRLTQLQDITLELENKMLSSALLRDGAWGVEQPSLLNLRLNNHHCSTSAARVLHPFFRPPASLRKSTAKAAGAHIAQRLMLHFLDALGILLLVTGIGNLQTFPDSTDPRCVELKGIYATEIAQHSTELCRIIELLPNAGPDAHAAQKTHLTELQAQNLEVFVPTHVSAVESRFCLRLCACFYANDGVVCVSHSGYDMGWHTVPVISTGASWAKQIFT